MKNFFRSLNIRSKLILGFCVIIIIFLFSGLRNYNAVKSIDEKKTQIINNIGISDAIKWMKFLTMSEMQKLNELIYSSSIKEFDRIFEEHVKTDFEIRQVYDSLFKITKINDDAPVLAFYKNQVHDTTLAIQTLYQKSFPVSFNEVKKIKKELINPTYLGEDIVITQDTLKNSDTIPVTDTTFATIFNQKNVTHGMQKKFSIYERLLKEHNSFVDKNGFQIIAKINEIEKLSNQYLFELKQESEELSSSTFLQTSWTVFIGFIISILIALFISDIIAKPLHNLRDLMYLLAKGELPAHLEVKTFDEIGNMSKALNQLVDGLKRTSDFAFEIGKGNFSSEFEPLSEKDVLGNSLIDMRKSLQQAKEDEEKRKIEDVQRNWATEGLARFAEILRHHTENINELSNDIIKNLVKYLNANQGGIFIYNDSDPTDIHLDLLAVYAYNRKKYLQKKIAIGEGLVGAVALEKYTIYMTDVPDEYIEIESGIGSANPKCILIVPLKIENTILGVIELASFNEFQKHEIELVEKIADSIAATLSTARITTRTAELLEQSKQQAQEMLEKEEELLQNIEALKNTQEESTIREETLKKNIREYEALNLALSQKEVLLEREVDKLKNDNEIKANELMDKETQTKLILETSQDGVIIINDKGTIEFFNNAAQKIWGYKETEIIGRNIKTLMPSHYAREHDDYIVSYIMSGEPKVIGFEREFPISKKDSSESLIQITICETKIEGERKFTAFIKDLSQLKMLEEERNKLFENLTTKEFDYSVRIDELENKLKANKIELPSLTEDTDLVKWDEEFSVNLSTIDTQHRKWIEIMNKLYKSYKTGTAIMMMSSYFSELNEYTDYHFGFEEKYLEDFKPTGYREHLVEHERFIKKIQEFKNEFDNGKTDVSYKLMIYLRNWVKNHIQNFDKKYVETFKRNGLN